MAWDFETEPEFQELLDWASEFVLAEVEPVDQVVADPFDRSDPVREELIPPLQDAVRAHELWAVHLGPELGGGGYGQVRLGLLNEILGGSRCAPVVFGCQAPDTGNAEVLAHYGTAEHKARYLEPLLAGEIFSCFSMTEPQGGSDPTMFTTSAVLDGDEWVINGEKWMSTNAKHTSFFVLMAVTNPDNPPYQRASMFIVPAETAGIEIVRNVGVLGEPLDEGHHGYIRYHDVRIPRDHLLGDVGGGFVAAQVRLGGGRVHHAMRTVGSVRRAIDMMCERAISRETKGELLAKKQLVQEMIAESWLQYQQLRILVLQTAWKIDRYHDYKRVRGDIAAIKILAPRVLHDVAVRAVQIHGALGVTNEMPLASMVVGSLGLGIADGATEVHKVTLARQVVAEYQPAEGMFPTNYIPALREKAFVKFSDVLERHGRKP
jgi:acyl-CoA dehydrogenase